MTSGGDDLRDAIRDERVWSITWCRAFPSLVSHDIYVQTPDVVLLQMAHEEIFPHVRDDIVKSQCTSSSDSHGTTGDQGGDGNHNLGYGEITPTAVFQVMEWLQSHGGLETNQTSNCVHENGNNDDRPLVAVDLGSGNGRVLLATLLAHPSFHMVRGLELVPALHEEALMNLEQWKRYDNVLSPWSVGVSFEFLCRDFTSDVSSVTDASLVWVHATVFDDNLMNQIQSMCESCASGTYFVMVTKPLKQQNGIVTRTSLPLEMNWGPATVYIQTKTEIV